MKFKLQILLFSVLTLFACGQEGNVADCDSGAHCSEKTGDEKARDALEAGKWDTARALLVELNADETDDLSKYKRYPLLAAAYAGLGGLPISGLLSTIMSGGEANPQTLAPDATQTHVDNLTLAAKTLSNTAFTTWLATEVGGQTLSRASIQFQQKLYAPVAAKLRLELLANKDTPLTAEDVLATIDSLDTAIDAYAEESGATSEELAQIKEEIGNDPQALQDYLDANPQ